MVIQADENLLSIEASGPYGGLNQHFVHGRHQGDLFVGLEKYRLVFDLTFSRRY